MAQVIIQRSSFDPQTMPDVRQSLSSLGSTQFPLDSDPDVNSNISKPLFSTAVMQAPLLARASDENAPTYRLDVSRTGAVTPVRGGGRTATSASNVAVNTFVYTAIGLNRPLSLAAAGGKAGINAVLAKFPGASRVLTPLLNLLPAGSAAGQSDAVRLEANTVPQDKSTVVHVKVNVAQLAQFGKPATDKLFTFLYQKAPTLEAKAQVLYYKHLVNDLGTSQLGKSTDIRITWDPVHPADGLRLGALYIPTVVHTGGGTAGVLAVSPRVTLDGKGKVAGVQLIVAAEADSPTTKSGFWAGAGVAAQFKWTGSLANSPIRQDASGQLGVEYNLNGQPRFLAVPGLASMVRSFGLGDPNAIRVSRDPAIDAQTVAKQLLHTDDPKVVAGLKGAAQLAENTGNVIDAGTQVAGTLSQAGTVVAAVTGISLGGILAAAGLASGIVLGWQEPLADDTVQGAIRHFYGTDTAKAYQELQNVKRLLQQPNPLSGTDRTSLRHSINVLSNLGDKYAHEPELKKFYDRLPANQRFPWQPTQIRTLQQLSVQHP